MNLLHRLRLRLSALLQKDKLDARMDDEMRSHIEMQTMQNIEAGMQPKEARYAAVKQFGGIESIKETCRDERGLPWLETLWQDIRFGARMLYRNPGFTSVAVLTLVLGIGLVTTIFSIVHHVLLRPPAFVTEANRLLFVWERAPRSAPDQRERIDYRNYRELRARCDLFERMVAFQTAGRFLLKTDAGVFDADGQRGSHDLLPALGVAPLLGRNFLPEEDLTAGREVVMISHELWKCQFGGDSGIIGKSIRVNDATETVVGVLPPNFRLPGWPRPSDFLKPLRFDATLSGDLDVRFHVIGRLKPSVSRSQAQAQLNIVAANLRQATWNAADLTLSLTSVQEEIVNRVKPLILLLAGAVSFVLLIACSNVTILLLGQASMRGKEMIIRAALGAGRQRLIRQFLTESVLLFTMGGSLGILVAIWGCHLLVQLSPYFAFAPRMADLSVDWTVLTFTFGISLVLGLLFSLFPTWGRCSVRHGTQRLSARASTSLSSDSRFRSGLMTAEFALVLILLVGAGLMTQSMHKLLTTDPGFVSQKLLLLDVNLDDRLYPNRKQKAEFYRRLLGSIRSLPGIDSAGLIQYRPLLSDAKYSVVIEGQAPPPNNRYPKVEYRPISDGYFPSLGVSLIRGRPLTGDDMRADSTAVVISQSMARRFWGNEDPLGKRLMVEPPNWLTVVGVVGDVRNVRLDAPPDPTLYVPHPTNQRWPNWLTLVIRSRVPLKTIGPLIRAEVQRADINLPVERIEMMDNIVFQTTLQRRLLMMILQLFAGVTVLIAAVGVYGIVAHSVTQRRREIGIRMALGATKQNILCFFLRRCVLMLALGLMIGLGGAFALMRLMRTFLYEIGPQDATTLAGASALVAVVALSASYMPARRATRVNPTVVLRYE